MALADTEDDDNLETLLAKATNPLHREPDPNAILEFCALVDREVEGPQNALRLLAHKIQSPIERESLMGLVVLEESVKKCSGRYKSEIGKFRFLNEMIKVVSPKYLGNRASVKVKKKIVEMMYLWSLELRNEQKIAEAYQMLKRQGVVLEDPLYVLDNYKPPTPPPPRTSTSIFEDEEKEQQLQKLLRSRNAEDLQAANRLIKNMVREADKKMELMAKRSTELETVHNNASVLQEMLQQYRSGHTSQEEKDLMQELYESCERLRPKLFRLAGELDEKDEGLGEILKANDELTVVINHYKKVMGTGTENGTTNSKETSLLDLASPLQDNKSIPESIGASLLDDQLLALGLMDSNSDDMKHDFKPSEDCPSSSSFADLDQIFKSSQSQSGPLDSSVINDQYPSGVFLTAEGGDVPSLKPLPVSSNIAIVTTTTNTSSASSKGLEDLDQLGQSLLKQALPSSSSVKYEFPSAPQKVPLSQLIQQKQKTPSAVEKSDSPASSPGHSGLILRDLFVPLETVQPGSLTPLQLHEKNGLTVMVHFGKDTPRPDVSVMVVSTMSKNTCPVKSVSFQAAVPKYMKIKLQPPSATDLPAHNPILPPAAITQVMLLHNPLQENVRFKYKINYRIEEEDFMDTGEVVNLMAVR